MTQYTPNAITSSTPQSLTPANKHLQLPAKTISSDVSRPLENADFQGPAPYLGSIAKFASPPPQSDTENSPETDHETGPDSAVLTRFARQAAARRLLPDERVADCLRRPQPGAPHVEIVGQPGQSAHYANLLTCARLWTCPVCAARITEQRAQELRQAVLTWTVESESGFVVLLTWTLRHCASDQLADLLRALTGAHRAFKSGAPFQRLRQRYGWFGSTAALETTHGENGWHPHLHELVFFQPLAATAWSEFESEAKARWLAVLKRHGRDATWSAGLDIREGDSDVWEYVAKYGKAPEKERWTIEREVAKGAVKNGRDGRSAFQLLDDYLQGDERAGDLFLEYAAAFKGKKQLVWSKGLKEALAVTEQSDSEAAAALPDESVLLAQIGLTAWYDVLRLPRDVRAELLQVAKYGGFSALRGFLEREGIYLPESPENG